MVFLSMIFPEPVIPPFGIVLSPPAAPSRTCAVARRALPGRMR
jgi:hypothetical protein